MRIPQMKAECLVSTWKITELSFCFTVQKVIYLYDVLIFFVWLDFFLSVFYFLLMHFIQIPLDRGTTGIPWQNPRLVQKLSMY